MSYYPEPIIAQDTHESNHHIDPRDAVGINFTSLCVNKKINLKT
jgi:hypothetical protein